MSGTFRKAVVSLLTMVMLAGALLPAGCSRKNKDEADIIEAAGNFIDAYSKGDSGLVKEYVDGSFRYDFLYNRNDYDVADIILTAAARSEIGGIRSIEVDRKNNTAKLKFRLHYLDITDCFRNQQVGGMTKEDYIKTFSTGDLRETGMTFEFVFDKDGNKWLLKEKSAEKYDALFNKAHMIYVITLSKEDAAVIFNEAFERLAKGEFELPYYTLDLNSVRVFDYCQADDELVKDAAGEFAKAYIKYIVDHGITVEGDEDNPYYAVLRGHAPSCDALMDYFTSDERLTGHFKTVFRMTSASRKDVQPDTVGGTVLADMYHKMAQMIPDMESEEYEISMQILESDSEVMLLIGGWNGSVIQISEYDVESVSKAEPEQQIRCRRKACEELYEAGEISKEKYDMIMLAVERDQHIANGGNGDAYSFIRNVDWKGTSKHKNQALKVYEYLPDWSDGLMIYGASTEDKNGLQLHYTKEPGWLNTAGYCLGDDGLTVMLKFDYRFKKGTTLIYDWYYDGEECQDSVSFTVDTDGQTEFEFTMPDVGARDAGKYELRVWEEDHNHVIAYIAFPKG